MVKAGNRLEPLLRRPFSVFEVLKDDGHMVGVSLLSKRIGPSTALLFEAKPGDRIQCLGPLGRPFAPVAAPDEAWLVAGGVGLAPFATLADTLRRRNINTQPNCSISICSSRWTSSWCWPPRTGAAANTVA
jgi:dihydroorotate dehydrogenase electron transfer subunit